MTAEFPPRSRVSLPAMLDRPSSARDTWADGPDLELVWSKVVQRRHGIARAALYGLALGVIAGLVLVTLRPTKFVAASELLFTNTSLQLSGTDAVVTQTMVEAPLIQSQIELARSIGVLAGTVGRLGPGAIERLLPQRSPNPLSAVLVADSVSSGGGTGADPSEHALGRLRANIDVQRLGASHIILIRATGSTAKAAAELANAVTDELLERQRQMNSLVTTSGLFRDQIRSLGPMLRVVSMARPPSEPAGPGAAVLIGSTGAGGILFGLILATLAALVSSRIVAPEQILRLLHLRPIGEVPRLRLARLEWPTADPELTRTDRRALKRAQRAAPLISVLRLLRTSLGDRRENAPRTVGFTALAPGEGTTTLAAGFAQLLAAHNSRVLVVDAGHPRYDLTTMALGVRPRNLADLLRDGTPLSDAIAKDVRPNVDLLPVGDASEIDAYWSDLARDLGRLEGLRYDWIVFDLPTMGAAAELQSFSRTLDAIVIVLRWGSKSTTEVRRRMQVLDWRREHVAGAIINMSPNAPAVQRHRPQPHR